MSSSLNDINGGGLPANVEYVCRLFRIPNPTPQDEEGRQCGTLECWSLADTLFDRALLERDHRARLVFLDGAKAYHSRSKEDPSLKMTAALRQQPQRDVDRLSRERQKSLRVIEHLKEQLHPDQEKRELIKSLLDEHDQYPRAKKAPVCAGCAEPILVGRVVHELGQEWHAPCFLLGHICAHCGRSIAADPRGYVVGDAIKGSLDEHVTDDDEIKTRPVFHGDALTGLERVVSLPKRCFSIKVVLDNRHVHHHRDWRQRLCSSGGVIIGEDKVVNN